MTPVAAVVADLRADVLSAGIRLRWDLVNATRVDEVRILLRVEHLEKRACRIAPLIAPELVDLV